MLLAVALATSACGADEPAATTADSATTTLGAIDSNQRSFDLQGHRGARGLRPENTLPAFEAALDLMVDTLEFDLHLAADDIVVVWHDPVVDAGKCVVDAPLRVRGSTADELRSIRCDRNPDPGRFPDQTASPGALSGDDYGIVSLSEVFAFVSAYAQSAEKDDAQRRNAAEVRFNIETKRKSDDPAAIGDDFDGTTAGIFERAVIAAAQDAGVLDRVIVQSFDHRSLWAIAAEFPNVQLAALTRRNDVPDFDDLAVRGATIWSPDHRSVTNATMTAAKTAGLLVIPWTVNDPGDMESLLSLGVDGLISDRPDLALELE